MDSMFEGISLTKIYIFWIFFIPIHSFIKIIKSAVQRFVCVCMSVLYVNVWALNNAEGVLLLLAHWHSGFHLSLTFKTCSLHLHPSPLLLLYLAQRGGEHREQGKSRKAKRRRKGEKGGGVQSDFSSWVVYITTFWGHVPWKTSLCVCVSRGSIQCAVIKCLLLLWPHWASNTTNERISHFICHGCSHEHARTHKLHAFLYNALTETTIHTRMFTHVPSTNTNERIFWCIFHVCLTGEHTANTNILFFTHILILMLQKLMCTNTQHKVL